MDSRLRSRSCFVGCLLTAVFAANFAAAVPPSIVINPLEPGSDDIVSIGASVPLPNSCWKKDSVTNETVGDTLVYRLFTSNMESCEGACLPFFSVASFLDTVGQLPAGNYTVRAYSIRYMFCGNVTTEEVAETSFLVGNISCEECIEGDANNDGSTNIADVSYLISHIFASGPSSLCLLEADTNGDMVVNIGDVTTLIAYIFSEGAIGGCSR